MTELFALVHVGDVHLNRGTLQRADAVLKGYARVGIGTRIEHYAVVGESHLLQLVYQLALDVALIVVNLHVGLLCAQFGKIFLKRTATVDSRLPNAQEIEVGTVDYLYFLHFFRLLFPFLK